MLRFAGRPISGQTTGNQLNIESYYWKVGHFVFQWSVEDIKFVSCKMLWKCYVGSGVVSENSLSSASPCWSEKSQHYPYPSPLSFLEALVNDVSLLVECCGSLFWIPIARISTIFFFTIVFICRSQYLFNKDWIGFDAADVYRGFQIQVSHSSF